LNIPDRKRGKGWETTNDEEYIKMFINSKLLVSMTVLTAVFMAGCPDKNKAAKVDPKAATKTEKIDQLTSGSSGWRTWTVYKTDTPDKKHMVPGHAFRLKKTVDGYRLQPLNTLRGHWGKPAGYQVDLIVADGEKPILCGVVVVPGHSVVEETHYILVEWIDSDFIEVTYEIEDEKVPDQCTSRGTHGGRAHAQN
jgi:hypothetical protein